LKDQLITKMPFEFLKSLCLTKEAAFISPILGLMKKVRNKAPHFLVMSQ